jgi:hypothetical protein
MNVKEILLGIDSCCLVQDPMAASCERYNETSGSIKGVKLARVDFHLWWRFVKKRLGKLRDL